MAEASDQIIDEILALDCYGKSMRWASVCLCNPWMGFISGFG